MRERESLMVNGITHVDTSTFSESEKAEFIQGWKDAGGHMGDRDSPCPWCAPWFRANPSVAARRYDLDPYELGQVYWEDCKDEIASLLAQEQEALQEV